MGITSTFAGKYVLLKDTTRRPELGSNPLPLDPKSEVLTTRSPRPLYLGHVTWTIHIQFLSHFQRRCYMKFGVDWPNGFRDVHKNWSYTRVVI